jgi:hypothetical protein
LSRSHRAARACALLIAAAAVALTIHFNIFTAWGTDSAAYLHAAQRWAAGDVFTPASFVFWAPWAAGGAVEAPLGHRPGPTTGSVIGQYPLGYPLLLAAALRVGGELAAHLVAPVSLALLAWCAFLLASHLSGPWAGVLASVLTVFNPVTLLHATQPMSDVPATALWFAAFAFALYPRTSAAVSAGLAAAGAIMVRPNLAPLAGVLAVVIATQRIAHRWRTVALFAACAAVGPAIVLWSQAALYGGALTPGYPGYETFFSLARVPANALLYPGMIAGVHTPLIFAGLALLPWALLHLRRADSDWTAAAVAVAAAAIAAINYGLYLPYLSYTTWDSLRFVLPALIALFILFAGLLDRLRLRLAPRLAGAGALVVLIPAAIVLWPAREPVRFVAAAAPTYRRIQLMGPYLREALPKNAVLLTYYESAAVAMYTGKPIVRLDLIPSTALDEVIGGLQRRGHHPLLLIDDVVESRGFRASFAASVYGTLDWRARAHFVSTSEMWLMDPADRTRYVNREAWPVDVLR